MPSLSTRATPPNKDPIQAASFIDGVARCTRYAFGPNRLHLCGPDMNHEVLAYITAGASDDGLTHMLRGFQTLYPYLKSIALANNIRDPFDGRVVEAYWLGNDLLQTIPPRTFFRHITEIRKLKREPSNARKFDLLINKVRQGAKMHHNFHVFNVWKRTGNVEEAHSLESLDKCRISWGHVQKVDGPYLTLKRSSLLGIGDKLILGPKESVKIARQLQDNSFVSEIKKGDILTLHWDIPCEIITPLQLTHLKKYTLWSLALANQAR